MARDVSDAHFGREHAGGGGRAGQHERSRVEGETRRERTRNDRDLIRRSSAAGGRERRGRVGDADLSVRHGRGRQRRYRRELVEIRGVVAHPTLCVAAREKDLAAWQRRGCELRAARFHRTRGHEGVRRRNEALHRRQRERIAADALGVPPAGDEHAAVGQQRRGVVLPLARHVARGGEAVRRRIVDLRRAHHVARLAARDQHAAVRQHRRRGSAAAVDDHVADRPGERIRRRVVQLSALRPVDIATGDEDFAVSEKDRHWQVPGRHHRPGSAERSRRGVVQVRGSDVLDAVVTADDQHLAVRQPDGRRAVANRAHRVRRRCEDAGRRIVGFGGVEPIQRVGNAAATGDEDRTVGEERPRCLRACGSHTAGQRRGVRRRVVELRLRTAARDE